MAVSVSFGEEDRGTLTDACMKKALLLLVCRTGPAFSES